MRRIIFRAATALRGIAPIRFLVRRPYRDANDLLRPVPAPALGLRRRLISVAPPGREFIKTFLDPPSQDRRMGAAHHRLMVAGNLHDSDSSGGVRSPSF